MEEASGSDEGRSDKLSVEYDTGNCSDGLELECAS